MLADIIPGISTADVELGLFIITALLFFITAWLAYLTRQNVRAANKLIELQSEPFVHIEANWEHIAPTAVNREILCLNMFIKNRGGGPARDINIVDVKEDFPVRWKRPDLPHKTFKELEIVTNGIKELAPYQDMLLARLPEDGAWRECPPSEIFFEYKTLSGEPKQGSNIIAFPAQATVYHTDKRRQQRRTKA